MNTAGITSLTGKCIYGYHLATERTRLLWFDLDVGVRVLAELCVRNKESVQSVKST
jgi:hypothetical protein